ncbi:sodium channel and clathrin linker 1 [Antennarius striatus]|uniref:sodium channel and clathrin linker 1 n=1 Tax=Antennarius striatus TaxID=241820 RepID=UPI0035B4B960
MNQNKVRAPSTSSQVEEERRREFPAPSISDNSVMAPLIAEYDRYVNEMTEQLRKYEVQMADVRVKMDAVVEENERLHVELREAVETQLSALSTASGGGGSALEEDALTRNLQEQVQLSEQERVQALELWQTASQELDVLQQAYQKNISEGKVVDAQRQQLQNQLVLFQQHTHKLEAANQRLESTNQQLLKAVTEQSVDVEELRSQLRLAKAELRMAATNAEETSKLVQSLQDRTARREGDVAKTRSREDAAERRLQQLQAALNHLEARLKVTSQEAEAAHKEQAAWQKRVEELQERCKTLEEAHQDALVKLRDSVQVAEEATLHRNLALLREKQKEEQLQKTKETIRKLIQDAAVHTRKQVENARQQCSVEIQRMAEELSALQLECADKAARIEKSLRERRAVEEKLEKVCEENRAEPELQKIDALRQRCIAAERMKDDLSRRLESSQRKMKKTEADCSETVSRCQEEARQLQESLAAARNDRLGANDERLKLEQEVQRLRKEMAELRRSGLLVQKKAKQQVVLMQQEHSLKEQMLEARVQELEQSASAQLTRLLAAEQRSDRRQKEADDLLQASQNKVALLTADLRRQTRRSHELQTQLEAAQKNASEHQRQLGEQREKSARLQGRLTQAEQRAAATTRQLTLYTSQRGGGGPS